MTVTKRCTGCRQDRPIDEFHRRTKSADGRGYRCRACSTAATLKSRRSGQRLTPAQRAYREGNRAEQPTPRHRRNVADELAVTCWCERAVVWVHVAEIAAGRTGVCGHPDCGQGEQVA